MKTVGLAGGFPFEGSRGFFFGGNLAFGAGTGLGAFFSGAWHGRGVWLYLGASGSDVKRLRG
jgi:hypothetical protein